MYNSLNSASQLTGWSSSSNDPCSESWIGISCSSGTIVVDIQLSGLGLSGSMGYLLSTLTSLTNLHLAGNSFTAGIPYSISDISSLTYINISHNQLNAQIGDIFNKLSALAIIDLSFNAFIGNLPKSFSSLSSAANMYLQNNQFTCSIDVLADLPFENLNVANNHFSGWIPGRLKSINNLQTDGNSWASGSAPPPPPGTPPSGAGNNPNKPGGNNSPSGDGGSKKSGIGDGGIAGIVISILVVGAILAFFMMKRKSRKPSTDVEKSEIDRPFTAVTPTAIKEMEYIQPSSTFSTITFENSTPGSLRPPPNDRHKSSDENVYTNMPFVVRKANTIPVSVTVYSVADLQMATGSFSVENLIGEGLIGRVYRA